MNFGPLTPPVEAHAIMNQAHELGINFFDTANRYGRPDGPPGQAVQNPTGHAGWTEHILGCWFAQGGDRRERVVLATKVFGDDGTAPWLRAELQRGNFPRARSSRVATRACAGCRPITLTFTRCIISTAPVPLLRNLAGDGDAGCAGAR